MPTDKMDDSSISRRDFFKRLGAMALASAPLLSSVAPLSALSSCVRCAGKRRLVILHTNDVHSHIDPFPDTDPLYPGLGGYARRESLINETIRQYGADNVLVFESGDMFQGTPYFNFYRGQLEMQLMNRMHIDAVTIGNHEFDNGVSALCDCMEIANFPFLSANYAFTDVRGSKLVKPYKVFLRGGFRVGVFGIGVRLAGLVAPHNCDSVRFSEIVPTAQEMADRLRNVEGCDIVIALTHIGFADGVNDDCDKTLAANTHGIDLILGGHSHTFLESPEFICNTMGERVLVNQVGYGGVCVGRITVGCEGNERLALLSTDNMTVKC